MFYITFSTHEGLQKLLIFVNKRLYCFTIERNLEIEQFQILTLVVNTPVQ